MADAARHRRRPTLVEWVVLGGIVAILVGLMTPAVGPPPPQTDADLDFSAWDDGVESGLQPPEAAAGDVDLAGQWLSRSSHLWLEFEPADEGGVWRVDFCSSSRCGLGPRIELQRRAIVEQGLVTLDRPVQMLSGRMFRRLYAVRVDDREFLVPSLELQQFAKTLRTTTASNRNEQLEWEVLSRVEPADEG